MWVKKAFKRDFVTDKRTEFAVLDRDTVCIVRIRDVRRRMRSLKSGISRRGSAV
jgi:hypothetical protein